MIGDGQVSMGPVVVKPNAKKVRKIHNDKVIVGFAGTTADAFTLLTRLEGKLDEHPGHLMRACVELAKDWRTDKYLRHLDALMIAADENVSLEISGNGDVLESHDDLLAIGSGGAYAIAAARALMPMNVPILDIAKRSMEIAGDMCVYTNKNWTIETFGFEENKEANKENKE